ncbi:hypothetical protein [Cellulomonas uda]|uniref:Helicase n=1 Tax=Cellulomonas uda TaxID=1714 RepID=A0A4Y3KEA3_CELUD|nr:hypothetical protein [Cellulomonas uda]NII67555.1 hypothetical protein [Cellulomonas uda]GEA81365.1 helicase [Cellulomonas uda]
MTVPARAPGSGAGSDLGPAPGTADPTSTTPTARPGAATGAQPAVPGEAAGPVALVEPPSDAELVEGALATWRGALVEAAGGSTLADIDLLGEAALDLSAAHPSGMAQLFAGRETRLSNLVREGAALSTARRRARAVGSRAAAYEQRYGIAPTSLAIGVATWTERTTADVAQDDVAALATVLATSTRSGTPADDEPAAAPRRLRAPVLLRPVALRARGTGESDYELALEPSLEVNPVLARALRSRGALLDPAAVARGAFTGGGFDPRAALQRLASLGEAVLEDFELSERVVVGTFVHPGQVLVDDLDTLAAGVAHHEVLTALAGVEADRERLRAHPLPAPAAGDRDPAHERGVGDLDPAQQHVLDVVATGAHLFVDSPTGADDSGTVAAIVADAAAAGRTVLYVPGHRRAAVALTERLAAHGLHDLLLDIAPEASWRSAAARRMLGAMTVEPPVVDPSGVQALRSDLVGHREALRGYVAGLHTPREPFGVSAYDALQHLARLTSTRPAPRTTVRLAPEVARALDGDQRTRLAADLRRAGELGAFSVRPGDTPWYGADLRTHADADVARRRLERLLDDALPRLAQRSAQVDAETGLLPAETVDAWGEQLRMLDGVRASLDVFLPIVFERTAADLVAATATKQWRAERELPMGYWLRRRLRRQAKDMVRPGRPVADLHSALVEVQARRETWQAHCPSGGWPRLPEGLETLEEEYRAVREDLEALDEVLAPTPGGAGLCALPLPALTERLERLRGAQDALETLPDRTGLLHRLRAAGLGALVDDLAERRVAAAQAPAELELAWWSTVIEQILAEDPALAGYDGEALGAMAQRYAELDRAHVASLAPPVRTAVAAQVAAVLRRHREQAEELFAELVEERLTSLRDTFARYPDVARRLRPVLVASPMLVPQVLPASRTVDLVVLGAAAHLPTEVALAAVARGRQVVVVGDARCASGSAVRDLAEVLPRATLRADTVARDPYLTTFLSEHGYGDALVATPLPTSRPLVRLDVVDGTGMPGPGGIVETTPAEVAQAVDLVLEHALSRPEESLAVVTVTPAHAEAVREAVLDEVRTNPALAAFFDPVRPEPFVVTDLTGVAGLHRDAVVLTLGLGRTPHRRVLHTFGVLSGPGGDALLLDALGSTRHRLSVVSCFGADDLDPERLRGDGPRLLRDLLAFAAERGAGRTAPASHAVDPDRLLVDLAERLWRHGLVVELDYGVPGGQRIPMVVGHPSLPGRMLVAVLTDDDAYVSEPSVRVRERLTADRLERLGWTVVRVWSAAAFLDPEAEVDRIRRYVHRAVPAPVEPRTGTAVIGLPQSWTDDERAPGEAAGAGAEAGAEAGAAVEVAEAGTHDEPERAQGTDDHEVASAGAFAPARPTAPSAGDAGPADDSPDGRASGRALRRKGRQRKGRGSDERAGTGPTAAKASGPTGPTGTAPTPEVPAPREAAQEPARPAATPPEPPAVTGSMVLQGASRSGVAPVAMDGVVVDDTRHRPLSVVRPEQPALPVRTLPRPDVRRGLPIAAYSDDQLDDLVGWLESDGVQRSRDELAEALRDELGVTRRSYRIDTAVRGAIERALS